MRFAIIAAGDGSRLQSEGVVEAKPLVTVGGERLIDRLLRIFMQNGATDIAVICNGKRPEVARHLAEIQCDGLCGQHVPLRFIVKDTPSSMHSMYELSKEGRIEREGERGKLVKYSMEEEKEELGELSGESGRGELEEYSGEDERGKNGEFSGEDERGKNGEFSGEDERGELEEYSSGDGRGKIEGFKADDRFILTTVDTIFDERNFAEYVKAFCESDADGMMAVTDYIDDEKPLYVQTTADDGITAFLDADPDGCCRYISAGIYGLRSNAIPVLRRCINEGQSRMRNFQRALVDSGLRLQAYSLGKVFDIDHATDIRKANAMMPKRVVGIYRNTCFSPNKVDADRAILEGVLQQTGLPYITITEEEVDRAGCLPEADRYLSMARDERTLEILAACPQARVINSVSSVRCCNHRLWEAEQRVCQYPKWVKRTDASAQTAGDVTLCRTAEEYEAVTCRYSADGIPWTEQPHYEGDLVKFYAVANTDFFHWSYPAETGQTKFGIEAEANSILHRYSFSEDVLRSASAEIADRVGLQVYGGDAIVQADGTVHIIDLNDWPSFAPCLQQAAKAIATLVLT